MKRRFVPRAGVLAAIVVLLAGGAVAALAATGQHARGGSNARTGAKRSSMEISAAAHYLGLSEAQLQGELKSGKSLAQLAEASSGKSVAGLVEAIVAAKKERLAQAAAGLPERVKAQVERAGGPGSSAGAHEYGAKAAGRPFAARGWAAPAAARYLGVSTSQLQTELKSGKSLAQLAEASDGKSVTGLVEAMVAAKKERLATALAAGRITKAREEARTARLKRRVERLVDRTAAHR